MTLFFIHFSLFRFDDSLFWINSFLGKNPKIGVEADCFHRKTLLILNILITVTEREISTLYFDFEISFKYIWTTRFNNVGGLYGSKFFRLAWIQSLVCFAAFKVRYRLVNF